MKKLILILILIPAMLQAQVNASSVQVMELFKDTGELAISTPPFSINGIEVKKLTMGGKDLTPITTCEYRPQPESVAERTCQFEGNWYIVQYFYNTGFCMIPATYPPGKPHYQARIKIFLLEKEGKKLIGETSGQYIEGGCFEDVPEKVVKSFLECQKKEGSHP